MLEHTLKRRCSLSSNLSVFALCASAGMERQRSAAALRDAQAQQQLGPYAQSSQADEQKRTVSQKESTTDIDAFPASLSTIV